jgi:hypothetical protein
MQPKPSDFSNKSLDLNDLDNDNKSVFFNFEKSSLLNFCLTTGLRLINIKPIVESSNKIAEKFAFFDSLLCGGTIISLINGRLIILEASLTILIYSEDIQILKMNKI